jgi:hypothetical protein
MPEKAPAYLLSVRDGREKSPQRFSKKRFEESTFCFCAYIVSSTGSSSVVPPLCSLVLLAVISLHPAANFTLKPTEGLCMLLKSLPLSKSSVFNIFQWPKPSAI